MNNYNFVLCFSNSLTCVMYMYFSELFDKLLKKIHFSLKFYYIHKEIIFFCVTLVINKYYIHFCINNLDIY